MIKFIVGLLLIGYIAFAVFVTVLIADDIYHGDEHNA